MINVINGVEILTENFPSNYLGNFLPRFFVTHSLAHSFSFADAKYTEAPLTQKTPHDSLVVPIDGRRLLGDHGASVFCDLELFEVSSDIEYRAPVLAQLSRIPQ